MKYKGFTIKRNKWNFSYGEQSYSNIYYVVFKEVGDEKYYLSGTTAFDTIKEAIQKIDEITK